MENADGSGCVPDVRRFTPEAGLRTTRSRGSEGERVAAALAWSSHLLRLYSYPEGRLVLGLYGHPERLWFVPSRLPASEAFAPRGTRADRSCAGCRAGMSRPPRIRKLRDYSVQKLRKVREFDRTCSKLIRRRGRRLHLPTGRTPPEKETSCVDLSPPRCSCWPRVPSECPLRGPEAHTSCTRRARLAPATASP